MRHLECHSFLPQDTPTQQQFHSPVKSEIFEQGARPATIVIGKREEHTHRFVVLALCQEILRLPSQDHAQVERKEGLRGLLGELLGLSVGEPAATGPRRGGQLHHVGLNRRRFARPEGSHPLEPALDIERIRVVLDCLQVG